MRQSKGYVYLIGFVITMLLWFMIAVILNTLLYCFLQKHLELSMEWDIS